MARTVQTAFEVPLLAAQVRTVFASPRDEAPTAEAVVASITLNVTAAFDHLEDRITAWAALEGSLGGGLVLDMLWVEYDSGLVLFAGLLVMLRTIAVDAGLEAAEAAGEHTAIFNAIVCLTSMLDALRAAVLAYLASALFDHGVVPRPD